MSGPKKGEQCGAFFWKAGKDASLANEGAVEGAAREGCDCNGESCPPHVDMYFNPATFPSSPDAPHKTSSYI